MKREQHAPTGPRTRTDMTSQRGFYGWKMVFILWLLDFLNMGFPLYGGGVLKTGMLNGKPPRPSAAAPGFKVLNLFVGLPSFFCGRVIISSGLPRTFGH